MPTIYFSNQRKSHVHTLLYRIPSTRKVRVYPLELCACFLSRTSTSRVCLQGDSAIMAAALKGHESTVQILLHHGASVSHQNKNGDSAIRYRRARGCSVRSCVLRVFDASSSVGISSASRGLPALLNAIPVSCSQLLLQPNAKGVTPLHAACSLSAPLAATVVEQARHCPCSPSFTFPHM